LRGRVQSLTPYIYTTVTSFGALKTIPIMKAIAISESKSVKNAPAPVIGSLDIRQDGRFTFEIPIFADVLLLVFAV
jgi:hypothetical protein